MEQESSRSSRVRFSLDMVKVCPAEEIDFGDILIYIEFPTGKWHLNAAGPPPGGSTEFQRAETSQDGWHSAEDPVGGCTRHPAS